MIYYHLLHWTSDEYKNVPQEEMLALKPPYPVIGNPNIAEIGSCLA